MTGLCFSERYAMAFGRNGKFASNAHQELRLGCLAPLLSGRIKRRDTRCCCCGEQAALNTRVAWLANPVKKCNKFGKWFLFFSKKSARARVETRREELEGRCAINPDHDT